jgi:radical SAM protein with 4Fe4S-binding SPASM domain
LIRHRREAYPFGRSGGAVRAGERGHYARGYYDRHRCYAPWTHALVDHVGRVSVCCMSVNRPVMGDLRVQSFAEVWQGAAYTALRSCAQMPPLEACRHCDMFLAHNRKLEKLTRPLVLRWLPL